MYRKRTILLAALAGLGLFISGCCSSPCDRRGGIFRRMSRPSCSSPNIIEAGAPQFEDGGGCCPAAPVSFGPSCGPTCGEGPALGMPMMTPPAVYTNGNGLPAGPSPRLVPQPQSQPVPFVP